MRVEITLEDGDKLIYEADEVRIYPPLIVDVKYDLIIAKDEQKAFKEMLRDNYRAALGESTS